MIETKLNWEWLKEGMCPKCGEFLENKESGYRCRNFQLGCRFFVTYKRYNEVVEAVVK